MASSPTMCAMRIDSNMREIKKLSIAISGASGVHLGLGLIECIPKDIELFVIISEGARQVAHFELFNTESSAKKIDSSAILAKQKSAESSNALDIRLQALQKVRSFKLYSERELEAPLCSGSFGIDATMIVPTSMNMLAKIANGLSDDLISRAASVMLKERRTLLLAPREMPLSPIALKQMAKLAKLGVIIAPPIAGYYANVENLEGLERFFYGKWLDALNIPNALYRRWQDCI